MASQGPLNHRNLTKTYLRGTCIRNPPVMADRFQKGSSTLAFRPILGPEAEKFTTRPEDHLVWRPVLPLTGSNSI
jgi:hypothetical protein